MNRAFTSAENSASGWKTTCTSWKAEQNCSLRKARRWKSRSEGSRTRTLQRDTVMGSNHLPGAPNLHPNVGEPVVILVWLAVGLSPLVIRPGHHSDAAMQPHPEVRQLGYFHPNRGIGTVRNITRFAVGVAILNRNHEILGQ